MRTTIGIALAAALVETTACRGGSPPCFLELGPWGDEMPDLEMLVGDTVEVDLGDHFSPHDCINYEDNRSFAARSSDPSAVAVSVSSNSAVLTTAALDVADSVRVTVWLPYQELVDGVPNPDFLHDFYVSVTAPR